MLLKYIFKIYILYKNKKLKKIINIIKIKY